jgi:ABC-2 type transport system permease protein
MISGIKNIRLLYRNFSPYQHKQVRIMEYPKTHVVNLRNHLLIQFLSQAMGFIAAVDDKKIKMLLDYPFGDLS